LALRYIDHNAKLEAGVDFGDMYRSLSALRKLHLIVLGSTPGTWNDPTG
jgi:hypothetical protein